MNGDFTEIAKKASKSFDGLNPSIIELAISIATKDNNKII